MADEKKPATKSEAPQHVATYASDKMKGGYLVRVIGPNANKFGERKTTGADGKEIIKRRTIPVLRKDHTQSKETLGKLIWAGVDEDTNKPCALYAIFKDTKKDFDDEIPF